MPFLSPCLEYTCSGQFKEDIQLNATDKADRSLVLLLICTNQLFDSQHSQHSQYSQYDKNDQYIALLYFYLYRIYVYFCMYPFISRAGSGGFKMSPFLFFSLVPLSFAADSPNIVIVLTDDQVR